MNLSHRQMQTKPRSRLSWLGSNAPSTPIVAATAVVATLAASALVNHRLARNAERANPPMGRFVEVEGVRLHYLERGEGEVLVLLHGNGSMIQDFVSSGLVDLASRSHRVIVFDRPGYGYSDRPRSKVWSPAAQADLIAKALARLGVSRTIVLGHSWGCLVAVEIGRRHADLVSALVLESGYYYPTARIDVVALSDPAVPVVGDVIRYTISPHAGRVLWPAMMRTIFGPAATPAKFGGFPKEMALRPSQIRASAAEAALMVPNALGASRRYGDLRMPVAIIAGEDDRLIDIDAQSARLHRDLPDSTFDRVPGVGHMVHQTATDTVMAAIRRVAGSVGERL